MLWYQLKRAVIPLSCCFLFVFMATGFYIYRHNLENSLSASACKTLSELLAQQRYNFDSRVDADLKSIKNLAKTVPYLPRDPKEFTAFGASLLSETNFDYLVLTDKTGQGMSHAGKPVDLSDRPYFHTTLSGKTVIAPPFFSNISNSVSIPVATPIYVDGSIAGVLTAAYSVSALDSLLLPAYNGQALTFITDSTGLVLYRPMTGHSPFVADNLLKDLAKGNMLTLDSIQQIQANLLESKGGHSTFSLSGDSYFMHYSPLSLNDWNVFMIIPEAVISQQASSIFFHSALLTVLIVSLFLILGLYTLRMQLKNSKEKLSCLFELEHTAYYDPLTKLPNLAKFKKDSNATLLAAPDQSYTILKFDIQNFKIINELFGFDVGNAVIETVATLGLELEKRFCLTGHFARVYADEFIILVRGSAVNQLIDENPALMAESICQRLSSVLGFHKVELRYGRYVTEPGETDIGDIIEKVNLAHRIAKKQKNALICDYTQQFKDGVLRTAQIESKMESALEQGEFVIYLQPKYALKEERVVGAEALVRWLEPDGNLIPPNEFIPLFEQNGFILKLDLYVFTQVCILLRQWLDEGRTVVPISVNFSKLHLGNESLVAQLAEIAQTYFVPKQYLEIELTESIIFNNEDVLSRLLHQLHERGFILSMDDFGTGYSSLGLLKNLPVDVIKMDRVFFDNNMYKNRARLVVESVMEMAKRLNICTVAEGVEFQEQIDFLREVGCDIVQGFYYARPLPAQDFLNYLSHPPVLQSKVANRYPPLPQLYPLDQVSEPTSMQTALSAYRLSQLALMEGLIQQYGIGEASELLQQSGRIAGCGFATAYLDLSLPFEPFFSLLRERLHNLGMGLFTLEKYDPSMEQIVLSVEDVPDCIHDGAPCSCQYEEGLMAGILYSYAKKDFSSRQIEPDEEQDHRYHFILQQR